MLALGKLGTHTIAIKVKMLEVWRSRWRPRLEVETWVSVVSRAGWMSHLDREEKIAKGQLQGSPNTGSSVYSPAAEES